MENKLSDNFNKLINNFQTLTLLPIVNENEIKIKTFNIIIENDECLIYDTKNNDFCVRTKSKGAAIAYVQTKLQKNNVQKRILELDNTIEKNECDMKFYKNTFKKTNNKIKKSATMHRLTMSKLIIAEARQELHSFILN